jgi:phosphoenolpyruvate carboxykinase (ATP)
MENALVEEIQGVVAGLAAQPNVSHPTAQDVEREAEQFGTRTVLGSINYVSAVKNLSTALTVYLGSPIVERAELTQKKRDIRKGAPATIRLVHEYLSKAPLVQVNAKMGEGSDFTPGCALYLSTYRKESVRLAHKVTRALFPPAEGAEPDLHVIVIPEWPEKERQVLVLPEIGVTYILGSDFYGEVKNAFLRMAMWQAKQRGMLGLHAASKIVRARGGDGKLRRLGMIMFGIAATGKTTHSCHHHDLNGPEEGVEIAQDDVVFWRNDGSALGSERGLYIRTEGLSSGDQPLLYGAAVREDAILENVMVDYAGNVHFDDRTLTANGYAIAQRAGLGEFGSESVNLPPVDELDGLVMAFMVKSYTAVPVASRLTPEQAAVAFMLSESIDAAGSDQQPGALGGIGASPFVIGDAAEDCNRFLDLLRAHSDKIECYMLNTGGVGEVVEHALDGSRRVLRKVSRVRIPEMAAIIRGIARGTITWREDPNWMVETPENVDGIDVKRFELSRHYDQRRIDPLVAAIRMERAQYADRFPGLDPAIRAAVEF